MLLPPATTQPSATMFVALARLLAEPRVLAARVQDMFALLHDAVRFHDARLVCWPNKEAYGPPVEVVAASAWTLPWNDALSDQVLRDGRPVVRSAAALGLPADAADRPDTITTFSMPLAWGDHSWGVLELRAAGETAFSPDEQAVVAWLLPLLAAAIDAHPNQDAEPSYALAPRHAALSIRQAHVLDELRHSLEAPLAVNALLGLLLTWAADSTGAEVGAIYTVDHERRELVAQMQHGYPHDSGRVTIDGTRRRWAWDHGVAGRVARTGRAVLLRDVAHDADYTPTLPEIRAELAAPIGDTGRPLAVLVLDSPRSLAFGERELSLVQAVCTAAHQPLLRALAYQESLEISTHLSQVFTSMPSGLALLDDQGRVLRHNHAWMQLWDLVEHDFDEPFHVPWDLVPRMLHRLADPLALTDFCASGQGSPAEQTTTTLLLRDPHQEFDILSVPTRDSMGQLTGRLWVVTDVTREREADRLKSEFISIVSHELRTPLTSILGYTELLNTREFKPDERREFVQIVFDQANHLSKMVEDLLGFSRLEAGKVSLNQWVVSLRQLMNELVAQLNTLANRHRMVIDVPPRLPPVYVDRDKIKQVLVNLITNAVKYSPRGGEIALVVSEARPADLPADHPEGAFVLVGVRDPGIGIAAEDLPHIWERFYRVDNTNTRRIGGTGLGLAITRALVELHGGRIWVESTVGKGSTFFFSLPVATEAMQR